jgi:O-antigen ligase
LPIGHSGISQAEFIGAPWGRPYSTFTEPDWYGAVCMFYSLLFIYLFLSKPQERRKFYFLGSVISVAGMFLSFVRASWIGFIAGIIFLIAIRLRIKAIKFKLKPLILILSAFFLFFLVLTLFSSTFGGIIKNRTSKTGEASISTENVRFKQMRQSLNIFLEHPVIGNGPGSFSLKGIWGNAENYYNGLVSEGKLSLDSRYDPGIITTVLADTGIIGAVFFLLFLFTFFKYNIDVVQKIDGYYQGVSMGLLIGIIGLFSSYILSTGLWMPFIWVFLGFNIASLNLGITEKEEAGIESTDAKQNQPA